MPTYQYRCTECGRDLEVVQKFSDASLIECPACAGALRKVFNAVGVVFKGSGFYRNDSRAAAGLNASSESNGQEKKSGAKTSEKTSEKADNKPTKAEPAKSEKVMANGSSSSSTGAKAASA
jgi:putative FmdB family regulatory protein